MQAPRAILYTTTLTNLVGATLYTDTVTPTTADDLEILDAAAARTAQQITGTWYGIFSGGGGNDGDTGTV